MADEYLQSLLGENEQTILVARQHWLVLLGEIVLEVALTVALVVLVSLVWSLLPNPLVPLGYLLLLLPLASLLRDVLIWTNHKYVITGRRVIQISGVFSKNVTDSSLEKVNDVKLTQSFLGRMLDYGDVEILTASELGVNKFARLDRPIHFKTAMLNAKESLDSGAGSRPRRAASDLPGLLAALDDLRRSGVLTEDEFQSKKSDVLKRM